MAETRENQRLEQCYSWGWVVGKEKTDAAHAIGSVAYQSFVKEASTLLAMTCCVVRLRGHRRAAMQAEPH